MDFGLVDDQMELASSPFRQADDLDLDLDTMRDPSVDPMNDMIDDDLNRTNLLHDVTQGEDDDIFQDDDMLDEENMDGEIQELQSEYTMDAVQEPQPENEDDDILYEEEEEIPTTLIPEGNEDLNLEINEEAQDEDLEETVEDQDTLASNLERIESKHVNKIEGTASDGQVERSEDDGYEFAGDNSRVATSSGQGLEETDDPLDKAIDAAESLTAEGNNDVENDPKSSSTQNQHKETILGLQDNEATQNESAFNEQATNLEPSSARNLDQLENSVGQGSHNLVSDISVSNSNLYLIKIVYLGEEMSLFPPSREEGSGTFFLSDASLALETLERLLGACREILSGSIGHDDELVLDIQALGLHICEDSKHATQLTLSQILETYLSLAHNDHSEQIHPLICNLSSRVCLASQYAYLRAAATEGKTFTEISADYLDSPSEDVTDTNEVSNDYLAPVQTDFQANGEDFTNVTHDTVNNIEDNEAVEQGHPEDFDGHTEQSRNFADDTYESEGEKAVAHNELHETLTSGQPGDQALDHSSRQQGIADISTNSGTDFNIDPTQEHETFHKQDVDELDEEDPELAGDETPTASHNQPLDDDEANLEAETNSSHTLQADHENNLDNSNVEALLNAEDEGTTITVEEDNSTLTNGDQAFQENHHEDFLNNADELYEAEGENEFSLPNQDAVAANNEVSWNGDEVLPIQMHESDKPAADSLPEQPGDEMYGPNPSETHATADNVPVTPMKAKSVKRKVLEDEDDFDLLDTTTPEPKRRRPS